jgi:hypothetical protein
MNSTSTPPFRAPSALAVLKRVAEEPPRPIPEIIPETPDWMCGLIAKLHAKNPADRFQSAAGAPGGRGCAIFSCGPHGAAQWRDATQLLAIGWKRPITGAFSHAATKAIFGEGVAEEVRENVHRARWSLGRGCLAVDLILGKQ